MAPPHPPLVLDLNLVPQEQILNCQLNARDVGNIAYQLLKHKYTFKINLRRLKEGHDPNRKPIVLHWFNPKTQEWEVKKGLQPMLFNDFGEIGRQVFGATRERLLEEAALAFISSEDNNTPPPPSPELQETLERLKRLTNKLQQQFFRHKVLHVFKGIIEADVKRERRRIQLELRAAQQNPVPPPASDLDPIVV